MKLKKIISGGQTGVDRAGLEVAIKHDLLHGGWCPPGRQAEDGTIPDHFVLIETSKERSEMAPDVPRSMRTEMNTRYSDGTLILTTRKAPFDPGTDWTIRVAALYRKPIIVLHPEDKDETLKATAWIRLNRIEVLHIAGPSESIIPGIQKKAFNFMDDFLKTLEKVD